MSSTASGRGAAADPVPDSAHEWFSFEDPTELRLWIFDVTFLTSPWTCIFGRGCEGVLTGPAADLEQGCCSYGAHFADDEDLARVEAAAARLSDDQWQHRTVGRKRGIARQKGGDHVTRLVGDACIFLNRPGFPGGAGCALHRAALEAGRPALELKPNVCWQLPLRQVDTTDASGYVTSTISEWDRRHWGGAGEEFHWWCTEEPDAFIGASAVYQSLAPELTALVGPDVYATVARYLDDRTATAAASRPPASVLLPHPVLRRRLPDNAS